MYKLPYLSSAKVVSTTTKKTPVGDFTKLTSVYGLPYARSIPVLVELRGMKPYTSLHGFIDSTNIDSNIYNCVQITINNETGKFLGANDYTAPNTWNAIHSWDTVDYQGNLQALYPNGFWSHSNILSVGEIIRFYTTPTALTAGIVIAREIQINPTTRASTTVLHVAYMRNYNSSTAYTDNFTSYPTGWTQGTAFQVGQTIKGDISKATGVIAAISQPTTITTNSSGNWFGVYLIPAGQVTTGSHSITFTDDTTDSGQGVTIATANYTSYGKIDMYTDTIVERVDTFVKSVNTQLFWQDPLAETFTIPKEKTNGCFVTSVDLFFATVNPNESQPVRVQITDTVNGYPGQNILFNATAQLEPNQIVASENGQTPTRFKFDGPVFLEAGVEYALKVLSNSVAYEVWISQIGDADINNPTKYVTQQPYLGVLFKSQNNSTWTADQTQDLKFVLYQAEFDTSASGVITVQNQSNISAPALLPVNPFSLLTGSTVCKVNYPNHGLFVGGYIDITGSTYSALNSRYSVVSVISPDLFTITLGATATLTGRTGGVNVLASKSVRYEELTVDIGNDYSIRTGTAMNVTALQSSATGKDTSTVTISTANQVQAASKYVHSELNESLILGGNKSLDVNFNITSTNSDLSPIVNRNALTAVLTTNRINIPLSTDNTVVDNNTILSAVSGIVFSLTNGTFTVPTTNDINKFKIGTNITISGTTNNNTTIKILDVDKTTNPYTVYAPVLANESPASTTIVQAEGYVDEIAPNGGTAIAKYQTRRLSLATLATGMQVNFSAFIPPAADIQLYYRTKISNGKPTDDVKWVAVHMSYKKSQGTEYLDQQYTVNAIPKYNVAQWKIVLLSTDPTQVPYIKNFTAIALA